MSSTSLYRFVSSYRGESDYVRRADGRRYRVEHAAPAVIIDAATWQPVPELAADWHAHRVEELADLTAWLRRRGWTLADDIRAMFPDVTDEEITP